MKAKSSSGRLRRMSARNGSRSGAPISTFTSSSLSDKVFDLTWARLHTPGEPMFALGAYVEGEMLGIAHYIFHPSCWSSGDYCYLQDLFVAKTARKRGLGRALIKAVYGAAKERGASRVYWLTHEANATARALYDEIAELTGFIQYRMAI